MIQLYSIQKLCWHGIARLAYSTFRYSNKHLRDISCVLVSNLQKAHGQWTRTFTAGWAFSSFSLRNNRLAVLKWAWNVGINLQTTQRHPWSARGIRSQFLSAKFVIVTITCWCRGNFRGMEPYPFEPGQPCRKCPNHCNSGLCSKCGREFYPQIGVASQLVLAGIPARYLTTYVSRYRVPYKWVTPRFLTSNTVDVRCLL